ncbi:MAG: hypothetical protein FWG23_00530 [Eggerthellaceae bacterium]|jgi:hypothetical protein|nr:hypothetical protein [Eggerthellaceae bacterium]MDR2716172.1 hypothetical protein [Coriobacteriaceae bacterium]
MDNQYGRAGLVGYAPRIDDTGLTDKQGNESRTLLIAAFVSLPILVAAFQVAAFFYTQYSRLLWLVIGIVLGIVFMIALLVQSAKRRQAVDFEGELVKKDVRKKSSGDPENGMVETYYLHSLVFSGTDGKTHKHSERQGAKEPAGNSWPGYLQVGDRVRYHAKLDYFEKYDKSRDSLLPCVECRSFFDIALDSCPHCNTAAVRPR